MVIQGIVLYATNILKLFQTAKHSPHILECFNGFFLHFFHNKFIITN